MRLWRRRTGFKRVLAPSRLPAWNDCVLDGHNRYEICQKHHIGFKTLEKEFDNEEEAKIWIIHNQLGRRNLIDYQRVELALALKPLIAKKAKEKQSEGGKKKVSQKSDEAPMRTDEELAGIKWPAS